MTDNYPTEPPSGFGTSSGDVPGDVKGTVKTEAGNVAGTAKDEAANVAGEAKTQAKDLLRQTQQELKDQAATQQQRVASGLHSVSNELSDMASTSENQGVASDVVRQVAARADSAAAWLDGRDPGSLLTELKSFARRRPGVFIAGAAVAGVLVGRLTRALASGAKDQSDAGSTGARSATTPTGTGTASAGVTAPRAAPATGSDVLPPTTSTETPLYAERVTSYGTDPVADDDIDGLGLGGGGTRGGQGL